MDERRVAAIFKAFCDENRIRIIKLLRSGEKCACKLLEEINEGKWTHYSISEKGVKQAKECLEQLTTLEVEYKIESCCEK